MPTYASQRPVKAEEVHHRALGTNLIGTLTIRNPHQAGVWATGPLENGAFTLAQALAAHVAAGDQPLLWAFSSTAGGYEFKFGYDVQVPSLAVGAAPGAQAKIGHVALTPNATISGEIIPVGAAWEIDNNSGAWGSMDNNDGKSNMMRTAAELLARCDPGGIVVTARRAYSRKAWKRKIQQIFR
jgi:hypothetical protein